MYDVHLTGHVRYACDSPSSNDTNSGPHSVEVELIRNPGFSIFTLYVCDSSLRTKLFSSPFSRCKYFFFGKILRLCIEISLSSIKFSEDFVDGGVFQGRITPVYLSFLDIF